MAAVRGRAEALLRALMIQASWSYERMQGVGLAHALAPLYRACFPHDAARCREALGRATSFFNANPYFVPAALGALARVEADQMPPAQVLRLRTALGGPLGALGDRLFWAALVPILMSLGILAAGLGAGLWILLVAVIAYNGVRVGMAQWLFQLGWSQGVGVGKALGESWVPRVSGVLVTAGVVLSALAVPVAMRHLLDGQGSQQVVLVLLLAAGMLLIRRFTDTRGTAPLLTVAAAVVVLLWHWGKA